MKTREDLLQECLEHLSKFTKEDLLDETEQLLECLFESKDSELQGLKMLETMSDFFEKGGLHSRK